MIHIGAMALLLLTLLGSALAALGSRQARLAARLSAVLGRSGGLLAICWLTAAGASVLAAWLGASMARDLPDSGKAMLAAAALVTAAIQLAWPANGSPSPSEPTRSFGAIALVLAIGQAADPARLLVFGLAAATGNPWPVAAGATIGSGGVLTLAWAGGRTWDARLSVAAIRLVLAGVFVIAALVVGMTAEGFIG